MKIHLSPRKQFWLAALLALAAFPFTTALPSARAATADEADAFFGLTNVWTFHLKVSAEDWAAMPPAAPARMGGGPMIHYDFKSVPATLEYNGKMYSKVGLLKSVLQKAWPAMQPVKLVDRLLLEHGYGPGGKRRRWAPTACSVAFVGRHHHCTQVGISP